MISRRTFLTAAAGAGGLLAIGNSAKAVDLLASQDETRSARVVLVKTDNRAEGIRKALKLYNADGLSGKRVVIKPNYNSDHEYPGSTHNTTLATLVEELAEAGVWTITVADRSGMSRGNTKAVMEKKGVVKLGKEMGFKTVALNELAEHEHTHHTLDHWHWRRGFYMPTLFHQADAIVQTCCLKTHQYGGHFSISLKNSIGMVAKQVGKPWYDYMRELHRSRHQRSMIAEVNQVYAPHLVVLDAMEAFVEGGPHKGKKVSPGIIVVGADRIAIDAVGVAILRMYRTTDRVRSGPVFGQDQIVRAVELSLGITHPAQIKLITDDIDSDGYAAKVRHELALG